MPVESLQQNSLGTVRDVTVGGSGITSAFANLGLGLASALGSIGVQKLASVAGVSAAQVQAGRTTLINPATVPTTPVAVKPNWTAFIVVGGVSAGLVGLVLYAARKRG